MYILRKLSLEVSTSFVGGCIVNFPALNATLLRQLYTTMKTGIVESCSVSSSSLAYSTVH